MGDKQAVGVVLERIALCIWCLLMILCYPLNTAQASSDTDADLFFVIDNSGSMRKNDPHFMTLQTVRTFLQRLSSETRVGIVSFDEKARLLEPLASISDANANQRLMQSLDQIDFKGKFTNSASGIERALYELKTSVHPKSQRCIIFLTDGIIDTGNEQKDAQLTQWLKNDLTVECREEGIRIFGIAFTENADFPLIQALSQRTGGAYYRVFTPEDIADVLDQIRSKLALPPAPQASPERDQIQPEDEQPPPPPSIPVAVEQSVPQKVAPVIEETAPLPAEKDAFSLYLPLVLTAFVLAGVLLFLGYKVFGWRFRFGAPQLDNKTLVSAVPPEAHLPEEAAIDSAPMAEYLPEWQLHDLKKPGNPATNFNQPKITIGRDEKNDFVIAHPTVSNIHATIEYRDAAFFLEDLRSANGTRLNERKVLPGQLIRLKSGDRIRFADLEFKFVRLDQLISGDTILLEVTSFISEPQQSNSAIATTSTDQEKHLFDVLKQHLGQIKALGAKYTDFVNQYFAKDTMRALSIHAQENMQQTMVDGDQHCAPLVKGQAFYVICTLPVSIANAAQWFSTRYGGFTKFVYKWLASDAYDVTACDVFCLITFGLDKGHWVSMTIAPTHETEGAVEIMSVDFLTDAEKASLEIDFDPHGRVS
jgi:Mg-chelatase subunit ChlD